jgi:glutamyl-tRNA synthetase
VTQTAPYRGRIAPSPTGLLHLGHAATFWAAHRRAVEARGTLVLRMEDLDPQRSKPEFATAAIDDLHWLGIRWQEGPEIEGPYAPYNQSSRLPLYVAALSRLIAAGFVYPCRCSRKDLAQVAQAPHDDEPIYPGSCRPSPNRPSPAKLDSPAPAGTNWRFQVPDGESVEFDDGHFGPQRFVAGRDFGDFLVWRRDGVPAYQLAVAVDDAGMSITEVVRGADLLVSTARQILIGRALGMAEPSWRHCPLVKDATGQRLAKRHDALSLRALRASGMEPGEVLGMAMRDVEGRISQRGPDL